METIALRSPLARHQRPRRCSGNATNTASTSGSHESSRHFLTDPIAGAAAAPSTVTVPFILIARCGVQWNS